MSSPVIPTPPTPTADDPFRLGWRFVTEKGTDGQEITRQVPLTERDLLFPQEGDQVMQRRAHTRDMVYLPEAFRALLRQRTTLQIFSDHRIDFNLAGVEPLGPDVAIIDGISEWDDQRGTLYLAREGRSLLVVEITSPDTRTNDFGIKRRFYQRAGVPIYVIVDHYPTEPGESMVLHVLRLDTGGYRRLEPDARGIVRLPQLRLGLSLHEGRVWVHDQRGRRFEETPELYDRVETLLAELEASESRTEELEAQFELELDLRRQETAARLEAEQARTQAEQARTQAEQARTQAEQARMETERQLNAERDLRLAMEERLRQLEEQLRSRP